MSQVSDRDPILGIDRRRYSLASALDDGEHVILSFERPDSYFNVRLSPRLARRLAADLVNVAEASERWLAERKNPKKNS